MAEIAPFRGVLFDPQRVKLAEALTTPDVLDGRAEPSGEHAVGRVHLPRGRGEARFAAAAKLLAGWRESGVLRRDDRAALYLYHEVYAHPDGRRVTRPSVLAQVHLHEYNEKVIRPFQRTTPEAVEERLKVLRATRTQLQPVFAIYKDPADEAERDLAGLDRAAPTLEATTPDGITHRLWRIQSRETISAFARTLTRLSLYIGDGQATYEALLTHREELRAAGTLGMRSEAEFGLFNLVNLHDAGLLLLPVHRVLHGVAHFDAAKLLEKLGDLFSVKRLEARADRPAALLAALAETARTGHGFVVVLPDGSAHLAQLRGDPASVGIAAPGVLRLLDVVLLHGLVLERHLKMAPGGRAEQRNVTYTADLAGAVGSVVRGEAQACFLLHPPRIERVLAVADAGELLPPHSAVFYPMPATGVVLAGIDPEADLDRAF